MSANNAPASERLNEFEGSIAVVTGASSGIGRAVAELLSARGARVALFARGAEGLDSVVRSAPERMIAVSGEVSDPGDVERLFAETERRFGPCSVLVNSAGGIEPRLVVEMSSREWDRELRINAGGVFLTSQRALRGMIAAGRGAIVNVASISGVAGPQKFPGFAAYCAAKAAVIAFTECLAVEVKAHGIRVNCVSPGSVDTPLLRRANESLVPDMSPAEVAETVLFLASDRSRPINGQNLHVFSA